MRPFNDPFRPTLAAITILLLSLPVAARAQEPPKDLMAFKASVTAVTTSALLIPSDPPVISVDLELRGQSDLLGEVRLLDHHLGHFGVDGVLKRSTDGNGVFVPASGDPMKSDAIFVQWSGLAKPAGAPGVYTIDCEFTVRGGRGRFAGATGSGTMRIQADFNKGTSMQTWEGQLSLPKR